MRRIVDIILISVLGALLILSGVLFAQVDKAPAMQHETDTSVAELKEEEKDEVSIYYGQALDTEAAVHSSPVDEEEELLEAVQIKAEEYRSDIDRVLEIQMKIADGSVEPDFDVSDRGRIDRRRQLNSLNESLSILSDSEVVLLDWWEEGDKLFEKDIPVAVIDVDTGKSFGAARTYGSNHADVETLAPEDTEIMKEIWGGQWSWERRAVIVVINGKKYAASASGMPHAGLDSLPDSEWVDNRSADYGTGANLDKIKGNNMDGHFDIHFLNSRTHGTDRIDDKHQQMVQKAFAEEK